jgi:hypothetical protein
MTRPGPISPRDLSCRLGLPDRLAAVVTAREDEQHVRVRSGVSSLELTYRRGLTLDALEAYAGDLESLGWPIPREILQDIRLRRALLAAPIAYTPDKRA